MTIIEKEKYGTRISVLEIERFAIHDGSGIRTVVFMQGCPLRCPWCSNPESQKIKTHLLHIAKHCIGCGSCLQSCPLNNITFVNNRPVFDRKKCVACKNCDIHCLQNAIRFSGGSLSVSDIMEIILRDKKYYQASGGGVTFSGGEAFMQFEGLMELLIACKKEELHTVVETSGQVDSKKIKEAFPHIDLFFMDIKHTDPNKLKTVTGADWNVILTNLDTLAALDPDKVVVRIPVLPGFNYNKESIESIFRLALDRKIKKIHLLPYHILGRDKYAQLGLDYTFPCDKNLCKKELIPFKELGHQMGLDVKIGG